tara:strand:+ start:2724 stop:3236 length:513 start_codon:yes stop_codon:yes gene_type:complete
MRKFLFTFRLIKSFVVFFLIIAINTSQVNTAWAKRPPEIRNQQEINLSQDMHDQDLSGNEFVKFNLTGYNFSNSNLQGAVFNNSNLTEANMRSSDMTDSLAYATNFTGADLRDVNFTNALLMESNFENANIDGADFTDAVISRIQQKQLCKSANGMNSSTGESTEYSLGC